MSLFQLPVCWGGDAAEGKRGSQASAPRGTRHSEPPLIGHRDPLLSRGSNQTVSSVQFSSVAQSCPTIWRRLDNLTILNLLSCDCNISFHLFICFCLLFITQISSVQSSSVAQFCLTLCDPMNHSTPGFPVYPLLLEFTQTHIHRVSDAIQPSHPLSSPFPPVPNLSQHQSLFQ